MIWSLLSSSKSYHLTSHSLPNPHSSLYIITSLSQPSTMGAMKVHQVTRGLIWEHDPASLTLGCKRFRSLAPKLTTSNSTSTNSVSSFDLKSFIRPDIGPRKTPEDNKHPPHPQEESHSGGGGGRWNPTQEQIGILEMLYKGGTRTPNAQQIEQITAQLGKYGKIEGKNVFYWFQNHKARERQKQKRKSLGLAHSPRSTSITTRSTTMSLDIRREVGKEEETSPCKRKCRSWTLDNLEFDQEIRIISRDSHDHRGDDRTLELFPLHPEGRKINFG